VIALRVIVCVILAPSNNIAFFRTKSHKIISKNQYFGYV
jgi:hypothetical protein